SGTYSTAQVDLELALQPGMTLNSDFPDLYFPSYEITHHNVYNKITFCINYQFQGSLLEQYKMD
ncbi:hypothetical protein ACQP3D_27200, partial [Escherichia coli]